MTSITLSSISRITDPGSDVKPNEDGILSLPGIEGVFDGATSLGPARVSPRTSDAQWFVEHMIATMTALSQSCSQPGELLDASLKRVAQDFALQLGQKGIDASLMEPYEKPFSSMAMVAVEEDGVIGYGIGDCDLLIKKHRTGQVIQVFAQHPVHHQLDAKAAKHYMSARREGMGHQQARQHIHELLVDNRKMANQPGGYPVLTPHFSCLSSIHRANLSQTLGLEKGDKILLCSDGAAPLYGLYNTYSRGEMFEHDVETLVSRLREIEEGDKNIEKYPRLKPSDDATLTVLVLG